MARPDKNNVDYFPFICSEGKKMYYLEETYGNEGFATFVKLLRELAKTDYHYLNLSENTTLMFISAKCKVSTQKLEEIISDLAKLGKFNKILWHENKIIWCQDFIDNIQDAYKKRKNNCITLNGLLHLLDSLGVRKLDLSELEEAEKPHIIVYNTIEENSKVEHSFKESPYFNDFSKFKKDIGEIFHKYDLLHYHERLIAFGDKYKYVDWLDAAKKWILKDAQEDKAIMYKGVVKNEIPDTKNLDAARAKWNDLMMEISKKVTKDEYNNYLDLTIVRFESGVLILKASSAEIVNKLNQTLLNKLINKHFENTIARIITKAK